MALKLRAKSSKLGLMRGVFRPLPGGATSRGRCREGSGAGGRGEAPGQSRCRGGEGSAPEPLYEEDEGGGSSSDGERGIGRHTEEGGRKVSRCGLRCPGP